MLPAVGLNEDGPGTAMLIREVENGYVIDVEMPGEPQKIPSAEEDDRVPKLLEVETTRFAKFVAMTDRQLLDCVKDLLSQFNARKPRMSGRILGNMQMHQVDRHVMVVTRLLGGYLLATAQPIKVKLGDLPRGRRRYAVLETAKESRMDSSMEVSETESIEQIVTSSDDVLDHVSSFFGFAEE